MTQSPLVTIYSTPTCSFCRMAKAYFGRHQVQFTEKDVSADQEALKEMVTKTGQWGVPVITVNTATVIGFDQERLKSLLQLPD